AAASARVLCIWSLRLSAMEAGSQAEMAARRAKNVEFWRGRKMGRPSHAGMATQRVGPYAAAGRMARSHGPEGQRSMAQDVMVENGTRVTRRQAAADIVAVLVLVPVSAIGAGIVVGMLSSGQPSLAAVVLIQAL